MSLAELADLATVPISKPQKLDPTNDLWTSRNPILLPPSPIPGQHNLPIPTRPSSSVFPRWRFALCASDSGDVYLYGGIAAHGSGDELYHYSAADNTITPLKCWGSGPGGTYGHAMASVGHTIVIHGGGSHGGQNPDLYLLNLASREWSRITTAGDSPGPLDRHAMTAVGTTIYIFGGRDPGHIHSDKLWAFDLDTLRTEPRWELVKTSSEARPTARSATTLVRYHDHLILYGGWTVVGFKGDVWFFDLRNRTWNQLRCDGDIPPPRYLHAAAVLDDVMYIVGGHDRYPFLGDARTRDVFALKIPDKKWFKLENPATTPSPRSDHAIACIGAKIFAFGGYLGEKLYEEHSIHILDTNYINARLHTSERLKELDIEFCIMINQAKSERRAKELEHENIRLKRNYIISYLLEFPSKIDSISHLQTLAEAQMMVDFLADELERQDILQSNRDRSRILHCLSKLAKSAQVFPKSTELSDVQCVLTNPVNDEGGYGYIYKGVFRGQAVCVKAVRVFEHGTRPSRMLRAQAGELVLLAHVSHPNVIPLYGAYLSNEEIPRICIVSPWMENGDLSAYLGKFPNTPKIPLMCDSAAGLSFLHDMGIVHADLKGRNVLVSRSGRAILADFGVATILHTNVGATSARDFAGTDYWQAPELLSADDSHPPPTKQSDMWGFACICYEMSTGETPFIRHYRKSTQLALAFAKGRRITPLRPIENYDTASIGGEPWVPLAEKCWSFDPRERPTAAEALQFLTELNVEDDRPSIDEEMATFKAIEGSRFEAEIDYSCVLSIVKNH